LLAFGRHRLGEERRNATVTRHGIIIVHGVGQHERLDVLTGFSTGVVQTIEHRVQTGAIPTVSLEDLSFQATLDAEHEDNYVEVAWNRDQEEQAFQITEAYWQRSVQPHHPLRILRWLWRVVTVALGLHGSPPLQALVVAFGAITNAGMALLGLVLLSSILRWLEGRFSLLASVLDRWPESVKAMGQRLLNVTFAGLPTAAQWLIALFVAFFAVAVAWLFLEGRRIWRIRGLGNLKSVFAWVAGVRVAGAAITMGLLLFLGRLVRGFPLQFPGKGALAGFLAGFNAWVQQDAFGDFEVFASDSLIASSMRGQVERQIAHFQDDDTVDQIHIVGHSLGGIICFEVLSRTLQKWDKITTFFSVGSPIKKFLYLTIGQDPPKRLPQTVRERGWYPHEHRFVGQITGPAGFTWHNIGANWDIFPDKLEKGFEYAPEEKPWGSVTDVPVDSTSVRNAHSAYWDTNCEAMRYILEQIDRETFGWAMHEEILEGTERKPSRKTEQITPREGLSTLR
jgi:hypothetical protein